MTHKSKAAEMGLGKPSTQNRWVTGVKAIIAEGNHAAILTSQLLLSAGQQNALALKKATPGILTNSVFGKLWDQTTCSHGLGP
ncbi:hypothetical protein [Desulfoluna limicola]|uniref:hypothetical protein n=1 Tax=Desulfoluna limicola TaxID=2810562 RepID=UPI001F484136|nr:hypothetical protein [Desulfoluna limicola]